MTSHGGRSSDHKEIQHEVTGEEEERWKYGVAGISSKESCMINSDTEGISMYLFPKDEEVR